jgi:hypothetical protein
MGGKEKAPHTAGPVRDWNATPVARQQLTPAAEAVACYAGRMANLPLGHEWPSQSAKTAIGVVVFILGMLAGVGVSMWVMPPS